MKYMLMKRLLFMLTIVVLGFSAETALACTCAPLESAAKELKQATAVFSGKVVKVKRHNEVADSFGTIEAVFKVDRVWKGIEKQTVSVFTSAMSSACGYGFEKGLTYLVYANGNEQGKLFTSICSRTTRYEDRHEDFEELGPGKVITKSCSVSFVNRAPFTQPHIGQLKNCHSNRADHL